MALECSKTILETTFGAPSWHPKYRCTGLAGSFLDVDICTLGCAMSSPYLGSPWKWWCSDSQEHGNLWQFVGAFVEHQGNQACRRCIFLATSMSNGDTGTGLFFLANREMQDADWLISWHLMNLMIFVILVCSGDFTTASFPLINEPVRADFKHPDPGQIHAKEFWQERHVCLEVAA